MAQYITAALHLMAQYITAVLHLMAQYITAVLHLMAQYASSPFAVSVDDLMCYHHPKYQA
jgi:hypothetical protein